jgi:uncharacterized protein (DUF849 family)
MLIEITHQDLTTALAELNAIVAELREDSARKPVLMHGVDATVWPLVDVAFAHGWSTRIGLEDGRQLPDGSLAPSNAALVAAALERRAAAPRRGAS